MTEEQRAAGEPPAMVHPAVSGKVVIGIIFTLASAAAAFGWWWHERETYRPRQLWGAKYALLIRDAPAVEVWRLTPAAEAAAKSDVVPVRGDALQIADRVELATATFEQKRGMNDLRRALLADFGIDWDAALDECTPRWEYALRLQSPDEPVTLAFAPACSQLVLVETGVRAKVRPEVAKFVADYFRRALKLPQKPERSPGDLP